MHPSDVHHDPVGLQRDVERLTDRAEIADLVARLGRWLDEQRFEDDPGAVFAEEIAVSTPGGETEGIAGVVAQARRNHAAYRTQHVITDVLVELDGDRATAGANLTVTFVPDGDGGARRVTLGERYRFAAVRRAAGWRLARVEVTPVWASGPLPRGG